MLVSSIARGPKRVISLGAAPSEIAAIAMVIGRNARPVSAGP